MQWKTLVTQNLEPRHTECYWFNEIISTKPWAEAHGMLLVQCCSKWGALLVQVLLCERWQKTSAEMTMLDEDNQPWSQIKHWAVEYQRWLQMYIRYCHPVNTHTHTHSCLITLYPGPPRWASIRRHPVNTVLNYVHNHRPQSPHRFSRPFCISH